MERGYVSLTPLRLDLTDHRELELLRESYPFPDDPPREPALAEGVPVATGR